MLADDGADVGDAVVDGVAGVGGAEAVSVAGRVAADAGAVVAEDGCDGGQQNDAHGDWATLHGSCCGTRSGEWAAVAVVDLA